MIHPISLSHHVLQTQLNKASTLIGVWSQKNGSGGAAAAASAESPVVATLRNGSASLAADVVRLLTLTRALRKDLAKTKSSNRYTAGQIAHTHSLHSNHPRSVFQSAAEKVPTLATSTSW